MSNSLSLNNVRYLSSSEAVGDNVTHFFKTRSLLRKKTSRDFESYRKNIPTTWNGLNVGYDIWWDNREQRDSFGLPKVNGFVYSDLMSTCLYFRPTNSLLSKIHLNNIIENESFIDEKLINSIMNDLDDKYTLTTSSDKSYPDSVIFLPGTNLLAFESFIDYDKLNLAVQNGAYVKPHPLTTKYHLEMIKHRYGDRVIDVKESGYEYLRHCKNVYCCTNSELGLVGLLYDKNVVVLDLIGGADLQRFGGYSEIYNAVRNNKENLMKLFSCEYSGLIKINKDTARIKSFFSSFNIFCRK